MLKRWRLHCLPSHLTPAAPFDSFTAAPILLKSLLSAVVGYLTAFLLNYLVQWDIFQLKLVWKIQQAPECAQIRFGRTVRVPHWLWWAAPSANSMWWNYTWNFCVTQNNWSSRRGKKHRPAQWPPGREGGRAGATTPSSSVPGIPSHCPGMTLLQLCSHSCYWILSQPEELTNSAYQAKSLHWVRHLSSFQCSCSFNWPEAVNGGKQQLVYTCLQCPEADDYR